MHTPFLALALEEAKEVQGGLWLKDLSLSPGLSVKGTEG